MSRDHIPLFHDRSAAVDIVISYMPTTLPTVKTSKFSKKYLERNLAFLTMQCLLVMISSILIDSRNPKSQGILYRKTSPMI